MILNNNLNKILIIDFGSQFTQLIARRIREIGIFSEIISHKKTKDLNLFNEKIKGIILSGGPLNVYDEKQIVQNELDMNVHNVSYNHYYIPIIKINSGGTSYINKKGDIWKRDTGYNGGFTYKLKNNKICSFTLFIRKK